MTAKRSLLAASAVFLSGSAAAWAADGDKIRYSEVAAEHCPAEWDSFIALEPEAWTKLGPLEVDQDLSEEASAAFLKYAVAVVAVSDYMGAFLGLSSEQHQNAQFFALAEAKFALERCLVPTDAEQDLIIAAVQAQNDLPVEQIKSVFFDSFDQFECMGFARASEKVFRLDPATPTFAEDLDAITSTTLKVCK